MSVSLLAHLPPYLTTDFSSHPSSCVCVCVCLIYEFYMCWYEYKFVNDFGKQK